MDEYYKKAISLPLYPNLSLEEQGYVMKTLLKIIKGD
jgi:dTDP-4-amino-4,6-dideoxygalactose transaminase